MSSDKCVYHYTKHECMTRVRVHARVFVLVIAHKCITAEQNIYLSTR